MGQLSVVQQYSVSAQHHKSNHEMTLTAYTDTEQTARQQLSACAHSRLLERTRAGARVRRTHPNECPAQTRQTPAQYPSPTSLYSILHPHLYRSQMVRTTYEASRSLTSAHHTPTRFMSTSVCAHLAQQTCPLVCVRFYWWPTQHYYY